MLIKTYGSAVAGINAIKISVEVDVGKGAKAQLIGLPDNAVKESLTRIYAAMKNSGYKFPRKGLIINMAPADLKKEGAAYDLTIAIGILMASDQMECHSLDESVIMGELSLDGSLLPFKGSLPMAIQAKKDGFKRMILPTQNATEASIVQDIEVYGVSSLKETVQFMEAKIQLHAIRSNPRLDFEQEHAHTAYDFDEVKGQTASKRAMEIAAAGGHNIILIGPPGSGKTMLAKRLAGILPPMNLHEALETTKIHSVAGSLGANGKLMVMRPFRNPHHTVSDVAMVGGGTHPQPGEISLAHNGILFLDELPEFRRSVLEVMRQPLEDRKIKISRAKSTVDYPSNLMLVASMNPCPCGYYNHPTKECSCSLQSVQRYISKISGPLMDRIDLHVALGPVNFDELNQQQKAESSSSIRERVLKARKIQEQRFEASNQMHCNAQMEKKEILLHCQIEKNGQMLLRKAMEKLQLSARAHDRILKLARTIADLDQKEHIQIPHLAEAIQYRSLDRESWGQLHH